MDIERRVLQEFDRATSEAVIAARKKLTSARYREPPDFTLWSVKRVTCIYGELVAPVEARDGRTQRAKAENSSARSGWNRRIHNVLLRRRLDSRHGEAGRKRQQRNRRSSGRCFRAPKDISKGDEVQLETHGGIIPYKVDQLDNRHA